MAEFTKKKRFFKYHDERCKKFLSRDFMKRCAYCKIREGDLAGPDSFEKDHFIPVTKGGSDNYDNLYYACASCNGKAGKSDKLSKTLLDPCKEEHQRELQRKLAEYRVLCERVIRNTGSRDIGQFLEDDIKEIETVLELGANYRMSEGVFDEDIDKSIYETLAKTGDVRCVDRDYDLFYQIQNGENTYLCYIDIGEIDFGVIGRAQRYIAVEKLKIWRIINETEKILIITYNKKDNCIYYTRLDDILQLKGINNSVKCGYDLLQCNRVEELI